VFTDSKHYRFRSIL